MPKAPQSIDLTKTLVSLLGRSPGEVTAWRKRIVQLEKKYGADVYRNLLYVLSHLDFPPSRAKKHWCRVLELWEELERATKSRLDLRVAVLHYFLRIQKKLKNPTVVEINFLQRAEDSVIMDELTRVYNYRYFQHRIDQEMKRVRRYDRGLSLLMVDVDDFKWFNDKNGHLAGNQALRKLASVLTKCVREVDVVCRYGGEEFAVILPTTLKTGALTAAEKVRLAVERSRFEGGARQPNGQVTVSIGLATLPTDASTAEELVARADAALYRAKAHGKNRVEAHSDERREFARFDSSLEGKLLVVNETPFSFRTSNVSRGGLLFRSNRLLAVGSIVQIELALPHSSRTWAGTARVVRVLEGEKDYEVGVKIVHAEGDEEFRFERYLATLGEGSRRSRK